jgi:RNA polymerase sigma-70 factor (ECF subfamily)
MDHPEVISGASKDKSGGSIFDSLMDSTRPTGKINPHLLATGTTVGLGAAAGAALSPQNDKRGGALAGGLAGLLLGINLRGESIPSRGFGNRESGMFAGIGARTFRLKDAKFAEAMERAGKDAKSIQLVTGMHRNASGQWQFEISDRDMSVADSSSPKWKEALTKSIPLSSVVTHSKLEEAYPGILDSVKVRINPDLKFLGGFDKKTNTIILKAAPGVGKEDPRYTARSIISHELQHQVQAAEGNPTGSNVGRESRPLEDLKKYLEGREESLYQRILEAERDGHSTDALESQYDKVQKQLAENFSRAGIEYKGRDRYNRSAGEVQARNTQARLDLSDEERRSTPVSDTQDIPYSDQIVKFGQDWRAAQERPLSESLQKTGEMDEDGHLRGMVIPEDKLPGEASVIDRARSGDQRAYTQLYNQYSRRLTNAIRGYVRDAGPRLGIDADDVVNAAFDKAFQNLNSFKGDSSFYTWLYRIARNESLNEITRSGRQVPTETMYNPSVGTGGDRTAGITGRSFEDSTGNPIRPSVEAASAVEQTPEDMLAARQASNMVQYAISNLPPDIREAIKLKELEGLSEQEIAQQKGIPVGTVKSRLSRGRDMIKQSLQKGHGALVGKQRGSATPQDMRKLAWAAGMGTLGATLGASLSSPEDKMSGFLTGAGVALAITPLVREFYTSPEATASRMYNNMIRDIKVEGKENISDTIGRWQAQGTQAEIINFRNSEALKRLVPKKSSRVKITYAMDTGNTSGLTSGELRAYNFTKSFLDNMGKLAMSEGVIHNVIDNYVTHLWKNNTALQAYKAALGSKVSAAMSGKTPFSHLRSITSLAQGKKLGLTPLTEDISEILNIYTKSVLQAVRNKQLLASLKATKDSQGNSYLVLPTRKSPSNYVQIDHPQLRGMSVHPTIAPELRNIFYTYDLDLLSAVGNTFNMGIKRSEVSFSLFHLTSLMDAYLGGMPTFTHPIKTARGAISSVAGNSDYHSALRGTADPATQQLFNRFLQSGGKIQVPHGEGADVDFNNNYYQGLQHLSNYLDSIIPHLGTAPSLVGKTSHVFDHIIFENGMSGMKFSLWMNTVQRLNDNWAKELRRNPKATVPSQAELDRMASAFGNNLLGSQNWLLAAQQATTRLGRTWLNVLGSPTGRKLSQYLLFAPDWTTSTFMSFMKALGHGSGPRGIIEPKTEADLHRVYQIRSAAIYALLGGTLNLAMSGHYIWDNKDPTTIDMGNGQRLQWNKHWTEPYQIIGGALTGDLQPAYNKLGYVPHEFASQVAGKEYINLRGTSPAMREGRIAHVLKGFTPIPFQGFGDQTPQQIMWNLAGRNVLGHPTVGDAARTFRLREENKKREDNRKKYLERMSKLQEGK